MNILFLHSSRHDCAPWIDGSTRYRCYHLAESLRHKGHLADIASLSEIRKEQLPLYDVVFVLRPRPGKTLEQILKACNKFRIRTIADVDDLVFMPRHAALSPSVLNKQATEFSVRSQFKRNLEAMLYFDEVTVATEPLKQFWIEQSGRRQVTVIPNGLSRRWLTTPVQRRQNKQENNQTITYLPGSNSHNRDFAEISDILSETLNTHKDARLLIVGTLHTDDKQFPAARLSRSELVDYYKLPQVIADSTVTIAPLVQSPFTHAKSHLKFIESAAFGTPAICSPTHDICRHVSTGLYIANTHEDWYNALNRRLEKSIDTRESQSMQNMVRRTATADQSADLLLTHLENSIDNSFKQAAGQ
ncbi:MAG: glycosyltransferase [Granulosicoccus sp.]